MKFDIRVLFDNPSRKFKFHLNLTRLTSTLHADQYTYLIILCLFLLRMRNLSHEVCRENHNMHFMFNKCFFPKTVPSVR